MVNHGVDLFQGYIYEYPIIIPLVSILNYLIGDTLWLCQT